MTTFNRAHGTRRLCNCFAATVQLFPAVSAAALDNDNQARRPGLSTEGTRGGDGYFDCFAATVQLFRRRRSTMTIKPVDLDFQPRAHAAVSRRLCDCFAATVQLFRRRRSTTTIKPVDLDFQPRAHATVSRRLCDCFAATVQLFRRRRSTTTIKPVDLDFQPRAHAAVTRRLCNCFAGDRAAVTLATTMYDIG
jgi:uncharacterized secreted protein with C-terminal beta-propeller domain